MGEDAGFEYVVGMDGDGHIMEESEFMQASQTVVRQVATTGEDVFMTEGIDGDLAQQDSIVAMNLRALACLPLKWISPDSEEMEVRGILYLDSTKTMHALSGLDEKILGKLALEAGNVFEKLNMLEALEDRKVFEKEMALAQETQRTLLPPALPKNESYALRAFSKPTHHVGGDFYDFYDAGRIDSSKIELMAYRCLIKNRTENLMRRSQIEEEVEFGVAPRIVDAYR